MNAHCNNDGCPMSPDSSGSQAARDAEKSLSASGAKSLSDGRRAGRNSLSQRRLSGLRFSLIRRQLLVTITWLLAALSFSIATAQDAVTGKQIEAIRAVGPKGKNHKEAVAAAEELQRGGIAQLSQVLAGMDGANPLATNWLRGVAEAIALSHVRGGNELPIAELEKFFADTKHSPRGRRLAYELIASVDPTAEQRMIPPLQTDPSLELRFDAIKMAMDKAAEVEKTDKEAATQLYAEAFSNVRDVEQTKQLAEKLKKLGEQVDLPTRMGFVVDWKLVGPFDNSQDLGWDKEFEPEQKIDFAAEYEGMKGSVKWIDHQSKDEFGMVDLNKALGKHKGAIAYAATEFVSEKDQTVDIRLGCITANKVWVNGDLVTANRVYHTGTAIDQYQGQAKLKKGKNLILARISQNEQTESWAQDWRFQLRVSDSLGGPILAQDRVVPKTASRPTERK